MKNKKGFTLAELLIVVAIIGVLVAISIPIFTTLLERSRVAVDQANVRSAKSAAAAEYMTGNSFSTKETYYYSGNGIILKENTSIQGYGKSTNPDPNGTITGAKTTDGKAPKGGVVRVEIDANGTINAYWEGGSDFSGGGGSSSKVNPSSPAYGNNTSGYSWKGDSHSIISDKNKYNTFNWKSGITIKENDTLYVFSEPMANAGSTSDLKGTKVTEYSSMEELYQANKSSFTKIDVTTETVNLTSDEYKNYDGAFEKGTVLKVDNKYYVAVVEGVTSSSLLTDTTKWAYVHD